VNTHNTIAVILAAGNGHRIGTSKWKLRFSPQQSFLEHLTTVYASPLIGQIVVVLSKYNSFGASGMSLPDNTSIILNEEPSRGRNHSIRLGLESVEKYDFAFIQNIDNPFTSRELITRMWEMRQPDTAVVPAFNKKAGHPVLLGRHLCLDLLRQPTATFHFRNWLMSQKCRMTETNDASILANINTPEDLLAAQTLFLQSANKIKTPNLR